MHKINMDAITISENRIIHLIHCACTFSTLVCVCKHVEYNVQTEYYTTTTLVTTILIIASVNIDII